MGKRNGIYFTSISCAGSDSFRFEPTWVTILSFTQQRWISEAKHEVVAPSKKVLVTDCDVFSARQRNSFSYVSFRAAGESHANKVAELPGLKGNNLSSEGSGDDRSGDDDVVTLIQQEAKNASGKQPF